MVATAWCLLLAAAVGWTAIALGALWLRFRVPKLGADAGIASAGATPVSVVVAARDEAAAVEAAIESLLKQEYPDLTVVAVDDRSRDATGSILDRLTARDPRLAVIHIRDLPAGWLGKNHAHHVGAAAARGEWILFTDGDVLFAPDTLARCVAYAEANGVDHLVAFPHFIAPHRLERAFVASFGLFVSMRFQPWGLRRAGSRAFIGIGAFNLVRRSAYASIGGHARLPLEVLDDAKLGMILRRSGFRQAAVDSEGRVRVRWNAGFRETVAGLLKNSYAAIEWQPALAVAAALAFAVQLLAPLAGLAAAAGGLRGLAAYSVAVATLLHVGAVRRVAGGNGLEGLAWPVAGAALLAVSLAGPLLATLRGGIDWRGTRYRLADLRRGCVRESEWPASRAPGW